MMTAGEFAVKIGLSGGGDVAKGLKKVHESFKEVISSGTQAKLQIAAVLYALERMTAGSAKTGMDLVKMARAFDIPILAMQKLQYQFRQFGAEDEVQPMLEGISRAVGAMKMNKGVNEGFGVLGIVTEGKTALQIYDQMAEKIKTVKDKQVGLHLWETMGGNASSYQAAMNVDTKQNISDGKFVTKAEAERLAKVYVSWSGIWYELKRIQNIFVSNFLGNMVNSLYKMIELVVDVTVAIARWIGDMPVLADAFIALGLAIAVAFGPITATLAAIVFAVSKIREIRDMLNMGEKDRESDRSQGRETPTLKGWVQDMFSQGKVEHEGNMKAQAVMNNPNPVMLQGTKGNTHNNSTSTTVINVDGKDLTNALSHGTKTEMTNVFMNMVGAH